MALTEGQWQVRDLVLGPGTPYPILPGTNPWGANNRAPSQKDRVYANGAWSGAEWREPKTIPINLAIAPDVVCPEVRRNLISADAASFEGGLGGWDVTGDHTITQITDGTALFGNSFARIEAIAPASSGLPRLFSPAADPVFVVDVPGTVVTISGYIRMPDGQQNDVGSTLHDMTTAVRDSAQGENTGSSAVPDLIPADGQWHRTYATWTLPDDGTVWDVFYFGFGSGSRIEGNTFDFDGLQIEVSRPTPSAWQDPSDPLVVDVVPDMKVLRRAAWAEAEADLVEAFRPIEDSTSEVECRFVFGGREYVLFGRPRLVEVVKDEWAVRVGKSLAQCAFVVLDGLLYSGTETCGQTGLVQTTGGMVVRGDVPTTDNDLPDRDWPPPPFVIPAQRAGGEFVVANEGRADTCAVLTVTGPCVEPSIEVIHEDGSIDRLSVLLTLSAGQELVIDTCARTAQINGFSQRRFVVGDWPTFPPGQSTVVFRAATFDPAATLDICYRSAWSG